VVSYAVMLDVPRDLIWFVSGLLAARRRQIGTRKGTRRLGCYRQALSGLAWFRTRAIYGDWAPGSGCRSPPRTGTWRRSSACSPPARRACRRPWSALWLKARHT
jgi:hypothetical protein